MMLKMKRMKELVTRLNEASRVYYQGSDEIMSNYEYDKLYDELVALEKEMGVKMADSPTTKVGYEVISELPKERHGYAVLSLDKTKDVDTLKSWLSDRNGVLSWKLDGLTVVATYESGELLKA
ncbi:MAG: NAD-dependent DNA ligase LigA, partial [Lachnospiraceae bacterium]|nr:NAD-dependent DNA ligase LigA [Lachnospiraceae bacterium]